MHVTTLKKLIEIYQLGAAQERVLILECEEGQKSEISLVASAPNSLQEGAANSELS